MEPHKSFIFKEIATSCLILITLLLAASGIGWCFAQWNFPETNVVVVYILSILLTARFTKGYAYGIISSILATCAFNYFFTDPYFTLSVNDPTYFITFFIMTGTALITSASTTKVKQSALQAQMKEAEASILHQLTNHLTLASTADDIVQIATNTVSTLLNCPVGCLCFDENGYPENTFVQKTEDGTIRRELAISNSLKMKLITEEPFYINDEFEEWPVSGKKSILALIRIPKEKAITLNESQKRLLKSIAESIALALDRFYSLQQQMKSQEEATQERYRGNLLRSISHDLRTPLSGIMGTSEILMKMTDVEDERFTLLSGIYNDADWLYSMVENILSLTRLEEGRLNLNQSLEAVEEVVAGALTQAQRHTQNRKIVVSIPDELLMVPMDAKLIEQVLINLIDNALKHSPLDQPIELTVQKEEHLNVAVFKIADHGTGISVQDLDHLFEMFYTTKEKGPDSKRGIGLGLAICEAIATAHGGDIKAQNRKDCNGAEFIFTLPLKEKNHE